jgi:hypothetical protein
VWDIYLLTQDGEGKEGSLPHKEFLGECRAQSMLFAPRYILPSPLVVLFISSDNAIYTVYIPTHLSYLRHVVANGPDRKQGIRRK